MINIFVTSGTRELCVAKSETTTYAKALTNCTLYKTSTLNENLDNIYFIIPETYFVTILESVSTDCFKVQYDKYIGYVESNTILIATFIPIVKTLDNITCDIKSTSGTQIWSLPSTEGSVLTTIQAGTSGINYVSMVYGTIPIGGESNLWYYISYTPASNSTNVYEGYVYSENVTNMSEIVANTEINPEIINSENNGADSNIIYISSQLKTIIIALISIPVILLISIILYKIVRMLKNNTFLRKNQNKSNYLNNDEFESKENTLSLDRYNADRLSNYDNEGINQSYSLLKDRIDEMKHTTYTRKDNYASDTNTRTYPAFPTYDSDDDLL